MAERYLIRRRGVAATLACLLVGVLACAESEPTNPSNLSGEAGGGDFPEVDAADPSSAPQGTTLDVRVIGSNFDQGSVVKLLLSGQSTPKIVTNSTQFVDRNNLIANITIAADAEVALYDIEVTARGKKGIGSELFSVTGTVVVTPAAATLLLGETVQLAAAVVDANGNPISGKTFTWWSSDRTIAAVTATGLVTAVGIGEATITAVSEAVGGAAAITVTLTLFAFRSTSAGSNHSCGLTTDGAVYCWGSNARGQLGSTSASQTCDGGRVACSTRPLAVFGDLTFAYLTTGYHHTCGIATGGAAYCWGNNLSGQLGDGTTTLRTTPVAVSGELAFKSLSAGSAHTCGVTTSALAYCWGWNSQGQLGNGTSGADSPSPSAVSGQLRFKSVSGASTHTCGVTESEQAFCWGDNFNGRLGTGDTQSSNTPRLVAGGLSFSWVSAGSQHSSGKTVNRKAYSWGANCCGQLGNGTTRNASVPVAVSGGLTVVWLRAGQDHTCAVTESGTAYCWGGNSSGQLGNGTTTNASTPEEVAGGLTFASLSEPGVEHTCGVTIGGIPYCWGRNDFGQLGDGTRTPSTTPVKLFGQP